MEENAMEENAVLCCKLEITGTEHGEWQGFLQTDDKTQEFHSVLELLCLIQSRVGPPSIGWKEIQAQR